ncbi:MAG: hypothetical protein M3Y41_02430, partial [Pseudomonadota bacterium]|nr:hypothetical protein [Pseudomonadota bacterium]
MWATRLRCPQIHQPDRLSRSSDPGDNHCNILLAAKRQQGHLAAAQRPAICLSPAGHQSCRATASGAERRRDVTLLAILYQGSRSRTGSFGSLGADGVDGGLAVLGEVLEAFDRLETEAPQDGQRGVSQ